MDVSKIDEILLVGGSSNLNCIQRFLENHLNKLYIITKCNTNPSEAIACGAAIQSSILKGTYGFDPPHPKGYLSVGSWCSNRENEHIIDRQTDVYLEELILLKSRVGFEKSSFQTPILLLSEEFNHSKNLFQRYLISDSSPHEETLGSRLHNIFTHINDDESVKELKLVMIDFYNLKVLIGYWNMNKTGIQSKWDNLMKRYDGLKLSNDCF
ncbi:hypothetical protein B566_EDAN012080 [Ephemera danica]|nr:hypothetical protein B566_EDAN012080 [Ephemera danica]